MKVHMEAYLGALQTQKLDPKLIMANTILQMSRQELEQKVEQELLENPALEIEERTVEKKCPVCKIKVEGNRCSCCGNIVPDTPEDEESEKMIEREEYLNEMEYLSRSFVEKYQDEEQSEVWYKISSTQTLTEYLTFYLPLVLENNREYLIGRYIISYIDDNGYLHYNPEEITEKFNISHEEVEKIIQAIQTLEPVGVGARNIRECITIQLKNLKQKVPYLVWELISDKYWNDFTKRRFTILAESLQLTIEEVRQAADFIKDNVNPYPGRDFNPVTIKTPTARLKPDVLIKKNNKNELEVELVDDNYRAFRINAAYKSLYFDIKKDRNNYSSDEIEHIRNYFFRAKTFMENINQRKETILKVTKKIVEIQQDFFFYGVSQLKPLTRIQVAESIGIHDSTVSRATKDKFVQLPSGKIVSFEFFFDSSLPVKEEIQAIISMEEKSNPVSDKEITDILCEKGIKIARRTVAKYIEEMNIPSSRDRKYS